MDSLVLFAGEDGVAFRVIARPSVVMYCGVMRVGRVADVVAQDARVVDNSLLDPFTLVRVALGSPQAELDAKALKQFERTERDETNIRRPSPGFDQFGCELVAVDGVEGGGRNEFEVDKVVGRVSRIQRLVQIGFDAVAPAVGFRIEIAELIDRIAKKFRHLFWKFHRGGAARHLMPVRPPAMRVRQRSRQRDGDNEQTKRESCDLGSCSVFHLNPGYFIFDHKNTKGTQKAPNILWG